MKVICVEDCAYGLRLFSCVVYPPAMVLSRKNAKLLQVLQQHEFGNDASVQQDLENFIRIIRIKSKILALWHNTRLGLIGNISTVKS